jgi:hypothetical protein
MNDQTETERTAALLRSALTAAADAMGPHRVAEPRPAEQVKQDKHVKGWLVPLTAAASVVAIALGAVLVAHLAAPAGKLSSSGNQAASSTTAQAARPEFYLTATYPPTGPNVLLFQVRRTDGGAVTASRSISAANLGWGGYLTTAAGDRAFYIGEYRCAGTTVPFTTFYRISITGSGRISGITPAGRPIKGMVTSLAVSPDGSRMAYSALDKVCAGPGFTLPGAGSVNVEELSTGTVRTWQDTAGQPFASRLSWAPDGRTLVVDEYPHMTRRSGLTVFRLDTAGSSGSLRAHSTILLQQNGNCTTCVQTALAGPDGSLTVLESQVVGQRTRVQVVRIPSAAGSPRTVLYSKLIDSPLGGTVNDTDLFTDPSGKWVLLWPTTSAAGRRLVAFAEAGWLSGGRLHPLPGVGQVFPQGIVW